MKNVNPDLKSSNFDGRASRMDKCSILAANSVENSRRTQVLSRRSSVAVTVSDDLFVIADETIALLGQPWLDQVSASSGSSGHKPNTVCRWACWWACGCSEVGAWPKLSVWWDGWPRLNGGEPPLCIKPPSIPPIPPRVRLAIAPLVIPSPDFVSFCSNSSLFFTCFRSFARRFWNQIFTYNSPNRYVTFNYVYEVKVLRVL